jgi:hypothetical protein
MALPSAQLPTRCRFVQGLRPQCTRSGSARAGDVQAYHAPCRLFHGVSTSEKATLPKDIPETNFWSFTVYDNQTRSMLDTPQRYPRASQTFPSPAAEANADDTTTIYFSPTQPAGIKRGNWIQTDPKKGWFTILRLYSPAEPFFTKAWRPSEIELVE